MTKNHPTSPPLPWSTKIYFYIASAFIDISRRQDGTVNRRLINFLEARSPPSKKPVNGIASTDITVDSSRNLWFRLYSPSAAAAATELPVIVYFHGGGFVFLSADSKSFDTFCRSMASKVPAIVVSVNYRLSPEHRFPAPYDDSFDVLRFLDTRPPQFTEFAPAADLSRLFLMGDSAGGNITHHLAERMSAVTSEFRTVRLLGLVAIQPFFGGEERTPSEIRLGGDPLASVGKTDWYWKAFLPEGSDRDHEACNVFGPRRKVGLVETFPATMVVVGGFDPLQDWQKRYFEGLKGYNREAYLVEYPNAIHGFHLFPKCPEYGMFFTEIRDFISKQSQGQ